MPKHGGLALAVVAALALACAAPATAQAREQRPSPARPAAAQDAAAAKLSLTDATAIVRQAYGGRILAAAEAERPNADGKPERGFRFRVDADGTVITVFVDSRGRIHAGT